MTICPLYLGSTRSAKVPGEAPPVLLLLTANAIIRMSVPTKSGAAGLSGSKKSAPTASSWPGWYAYDTTVDASTAFINEEIGVCQTTSATGAPFSLMSLSAIAMGASRTTLSFTFGYSLVKSAKYVSDWACGSEV